MQATSLTFVFAHGAGAPMDSPFMETVAQGLTARGIRVVRFEFPYMAKKRRGESSGPPDRPAILEACFREVVKAQGVDASQIAIGGKSLGSRMAAHVADELGVRALVAFGYPFFPPKQTSTARLGKLLELKTKALIVQGTRDPFGTREQLSALTLPSSITLHFIEDGDHSFKPRKKSGRSEEQNLTEAVTVAADFMLKA